jgi:hypothetical protein
MPDRVCQAERETTKKAKICKSCGAAAALEAAILELLAERGRDKTICPSEAAKFVGGKASRRDWEGLMEPAREAARRLVAAGRIVVTQRGRVVDASTAKGAIRLRLK